MLSPASYVAAEQLADRQADAVAFRAAREAAPVVAAPRDHLVLRRSVPAGRRGAHAPGAARRRPAPRRRRAGRRARRRDRRRRAVRRRPRDRRPVPPHRRARRAAARADRQAARPPAGCRACAPTCARASPPKGSSPASKGSRRPHAHPDRRSHAIHSDLIIHLASARAFRTSYSPSGNSHDQQPPDRARGGARGARGRACATRRLGGRPWPSSRVSRASASPAWWPSSRAARGTPGRASRSASASSSARRSCPTPRS